MNKKILGAALGLAVLAASAHVDVAIGLGIPGAVYAPAEPVYAPPPPVVYAPAPVAVAYGGDDDWRAREWREREWRRQEWREHDRRGHGRDGY
ncbi:hypothetical protein [Paraburkholderia sp. RL18-085-BIA-A]|jgi:hypothetical protein|uniref:hypothetical protein n=1 Tax=Paraburkholderia sp. RL18-085-BIA-A TaxID=3031633 RepID=UPI0038BDCA36